ncbi:MAG: hypothetical protein ACYCZ2_12860 [Lutibacter sp.]|nr:MAG: hypothetical protein APF83_11300 [Lutibacter sp. BRH_c52]
MNIESLISKIELFNELVIKSGFKRDVTDFIQSIQQAQNRNIVFMKDLSNKVKNKLTDFENYGLDSELTLILRESKPFTELKTLNQLEELDQNTEIDGNAYFAQFNQLLNQLIQQIDQNKNEIDTVLLIFQKYVSEDDYESEGDRALVSLIFKDLKSTGSLKEFAKVLNRWNRMLLVYHTLLTSDSPKEIELVEIQNGSIDVIFNIDFDIAIDLTELIKTGLKVYGAYLLYKSKTAKVIIESYMGNQKLIKQEKDREKLMLENIKESIALKALIQHKEKIKRDKKIEKTSIDVKIEEVSSVITDHIIKGNELKLLTPPDTTESEEETTNVAVELREETAKVRETFKKLSTQEKQLLLQKYSIKDDENE